MTPDELRRMDTNECIIFVQAMKPIKAQKYWYYKMHPMREMARTSEESHKGIAEPKRGKYRITNPYEINNSSDLSDLFGPSKEEDIDIAIDKDISMSNSKKENIEVVNETQKQTKEDIDLQAELEKKFDELFGAPTKKY